MLVALADGNSFSEAGRLLGLTQSAVSHGLARLESELGVALVERGRRGVTLTDAGQRVLEHARQVSVHVEAIRGLGESEEVTGKLRLGLSSPLPAHLVVGVAARFRRSYPAVELMMAAMGTSDIGIRLVEGPLDLGFVASPPPKSAKDLSFRLVLRDEVCAVVARSHALSRQVSLEVADLFSETVLLPNAGQERLIEALRDPQGRSQVRHFMSDAHMLLVAAQEGVGVALIPRSLLPSPDVLQRQGTVALSCEPALSWEIGLLARSWESASKSVVLFAQVAQEWVNDNGLAPASS